MKKPLYVFLWIIAFCIQKMLIFFILKIKQLLSLYIRFIFSYNRIPILK